jgi:hypothetical protein
MVHVMGAPDRTDWSEHIGWPTLMENTLELLGIVRGAILYLADVIRIRETPNQVKDPSASIGLPLLFGRADTDLEEVE